MDSRLTISFTSHLYLLSHSNPHPLIHTLSLPHLKLHGTSTSRLITCTPSLPPSVRHILVSPSETYLAVWGGSVAHVVTLPHNAMEKKLAEKASEIKAK